VLFGFSVRRLRGEKRYRAGVHFDRLKNPFPQVGSHENIGVDSKRYPAFRFFSRAVRRISL
jgi:hypothetical protein